MTDSWPSVLLPLLVGAVLVVLPGWVVARAGGARGLLAVGLGPLLTASASAVGILVGQRLGLRWGLGEIVLGAALLTLLAVVGRRILTPIESRGRSRLGLPEALPSWGLSTGRVDTRWLFGATLLGSLIILALAGSAMRGPAEIVQSYDTSFHLSAIDAVVREGDATPGLVGRVNRFAGTAAFYPPLFHALGAQLATLSGGGAVVGANLAALICGTVAWPLSMLALTLTLTKQRLTGGLTIVAACVLPAFPYLLMSAGILWPMLLGLSILPGVVACLCQGLLGGTDSRVPALVLAAGALPGLYYAHPSIVLTCALIALVLIVVGMVSRAARPGPVGRRLAWLGLAALTLLASWPAYGVLIQVPSIASLAKFNAPKAESTQAAWVEILKLGPSSVVAGIAPSNAAVPVLGLLVVVGAVSALRSRRLAWVPVLHLVIAGLYVLAAASDSPLSQKLTMVWYNDRNRLAAMLALTAAPLIGLGAAALVRGVQLLTHRVAARRPVTPQHRRWVVIALTCILALAAIRGLPAARDVVRAGYDGRPHLILVSPGEAALYESLPAPVDPDARLLGSPLGGAAVGALLAHRTPVLTHFNNVMDPDRLLLSQKFNAYGRDPSVCAAAKRLRIDYAAEDTDIFMSSDWNRKTFPGLMDLGKAPGLDKVATNGSATLYRLQPCQA